MIMITRTRRSMRVRRRRLVGSSTSMAVLEYSWTSLSRRVPSLSVPLGLSMGDCSMCEVSCLSMLDGRFAIAIQKGNITREAGAAFYQVPGYHPPFTYVLQCPIPVYPMLYTLPQISVSPQRGKAARVYSLVQSKGPLGFRCRETDEIFRVSASIQQV